MSGPQDLNGIVEFLLNQNNIQHYHFWYEGKDGWSPVESDYELVALLKKTKGVNIPPPPPPPPMANGPAINKEKTIETPQEASIVLEPQAKEEKIIVINKEESDSQQQATPANQRSHPRVQCNMRTIITNKKKTFITNSIDISMSGIKVSHAIPEEIFQGDCEVYITGPSNFGSILIKCKPVTQTNQTERFSFINMDEKNQTKLKTWFDNLVQQSK